MWAFHQNMYNDILGLNCRRILGTELQERIPFSGYSYLPFYKGPLLKERVALRESEQIRPSRIALIVRPGKILQQMNGRPVICPVLNHFSRSQPINQNMYTLSLNLLVLF